VRIFVGFGYNERDRWIKELVFPLVESFGDEVVTGEDMPGEILSETVKERIRTSHGLIGFLTRRTPMNGGGWSTHRWVIEELAHAATLHVSLVEVRETGIDPQGGALGDRQWVPYDEAARAQCLVAVAKVLGKWHREQGSFRLQLLPADLMPQIVPLYRRPGFTSQYRLILADGDETEARPAPVVPMQGGLFVKLTSVPRDALVQVELTYNGDRERQTWISSFESLDAIGVVLQKG